ncbi:MAG TPA: Cof-type HAD-IIB family hydrolase [Firmicutes bacterium]|nr:Cof-type HAD-IIB family hydrolase [Bacillota bacterium]
MKKAIFLDIDGTILDFHNEITSITPAVEKAIRGLQEAGHYVFIATGRPYAFLNPHLLEFGFDGYILSNGAQVLMNNENIYTAGMEVPFVQEFTQALEGRNIEYMLQSHDYSYMKEECTEYYGMLKRMGVSLDMMQTEFQIEDVLTQKMQVLCRDEDEMAFCMSYVEDHPKYAHFHSMGAQQFELYAKNYTKATGILKTLEHLEIPIERSYAFGDEMNDIEMLATVGCGIAMGNASDHVKSFANVVTKSVLEDGVAHGIVEFVLAE